MKLNAGVLIKIILIVVAALVPIVLLWNLRSVYIKVGDLPEFFTTAWMMVHGKGTLIYDISQQKIWQHYLFPALGKRFIPIYVPPFAVLGLFPLSWLSASAVPFVWTGFLLVCHAVTTLVLGRLFKLKLSGLILLGVTLTLSGPGIEGLRIGQLSPLLLLFLSLGLLALKYSHPILAGLSLSVLLLKPQELAPFIAYLFGARQLKTCTVVFVAMIAGVLGSLWTMGGQIYPSYFNLLDASSKNPVYIHFMQPEWCTTLRGQLLRIVPTMSSEINLLSAVICILMLVFIAWCGSRLSRKKSWLEYGLMTVVPLGLITSLHCFSYDTVLIVPGIAALLKSRLWRELRHSLKLLIFMSGLIFFHPAYAVVYYGYLMGGGVLNLFFWFFLILFMYFTMLVIREPDKVE